MVANNTTRTQQHPLMYDLLIQKGFTDPTKSTQEGETPRYLMVITPYFRVTVVQKGLDSPEYQLHSISLDEGKEIYVTDPEFPSIKKQLQTLETLLEVIENPEKMLKIIARTKGHEISLKDLKLEAGYLTPLWNKQY